MRTDSTRLLIVRTAGRTVDLVAGSSVVVGRAEECDLVVEHPEVSRSHLRLQRADDHVLAFDLDSRRGTWLDGERLSGVRHLPVPSEVRLGAHGPVVRVEAGPREPTPRHTGAPHHALAETGDMLIVGRGPDCDVRVPHDMMVSQRHARVVLEAGGAVVTDLDSHNGTFVNGQRVSRAPLGVRDELSVGRHRFRLRGGMLRPRSDDGQVTFAARGLGFTLRDGRALLDDISFSLPRHSLLAVVGPSGAGKSTLLSALTGRQPPSQGHVLYNGRDLHARLDELRDRIGLVPQQDIVHGPLSVRAALRAAADLRFPADADPEEKEARIEEVVAELGLTAHIDTRVSALSGGQRKRASVAMELLTKPPLLFLDEPTSGLDPGMDKQLMGTLRELADSGRTVIVITHSTESLELCDRVLFLAPGGRTAFFGPPEEALDSIGTRSFSAAFHKVEHEPEAVVAAFRSSMLHRSMVETPLDTLDRQRSMSKASAPAPAVSPVDRRRTAWHQIRTLVRRQARVMLADRGFVGMSLAMPFVIALLALLVPGGQDLAAAIDPVAASGQPQQVLLVLTLGAIFIGLASSIRDLVGERAIFVRERAVGLGPTAYLSSKVAVLGGVAMAQCLVMLALVAALRTLPDGGVLLPGAAGAGMELAVGLCATALTCTVLGLLISSLLRSAAQVMPVIVVLVMGLLVLSGGLFGFGDRELLDRASWLAPSRWGYASLAATVDLNAVGHSPDDTLWEPSGWGWVRDLVVLAGMAMVLALGCRWRLGRPYPER